MASPSTPASTGTPGTPTLPPQQQQQQDVESVTHIQMAGLTVLMIRKKDQVIYKLPDNMSVHSLSTEQRERLLAEINLLHHQQTTAQAIAATQTQLQEVQQQQQQQQAMASASGKTTPTTPGMGLAGAVTSAMTSARTILSVGGSKPSIVTTSTPAAAAAAAAAALADGQQKTTRRYNKTGKYSKKKLQQQQALDQQQQAGTQKGKSVATTGLSTPYARPSSSTSTSTSTSTSSSAALDPTAQASSVSLPTNIRPLLLQQQLQQQQNVEGLFSLDQKRQYSLLTEIHQLQQQIEAQLSTINILQKALTQSMEESVQNLVKLSLVEAVKTLDRLKAQLREKEKSFTTQFPIASQQLILLQQQQQQQQQHQQQQQQQPSGTTASQSQISASIAGNGGEAGTLVGAGLFQGAGAGLTPTVPRTLEEQLQQQIAEHHGSVRGSMLKELQLVHQRLEQSDYQTPFTSLQDAIGRLLPFHVFQYPPQDIEAHAKAFVDRKKVELDAQAVVIHKRTQDLYKRFHSMVKTRAEKPTHKTPSSALDVVLLRLLMEDEQGEFQRVKGEHERTTAAAKALQDELEPKWQQLMNQRKVEAVMIEQQQKLILERFRLEALEQQKQQQQQQLLQQQQQDEKQKASETDASRIQPSQGQETMTTTTTTASSGTAAQPTHSTNRIEPTASAVP